MRVILLQNIRGLGKIGEVKNVADGYGRNFLIPRKLAKIGTESAMKESESLRKRAEIMERVQQGRAKDLVETIKDMIVEISRKANDKGTLFEGIEAMDIAQALRNKITFDITKDMINLPEPIKRIGRHTVEVELSPNIKTNVIINVK